MKKKNNLLFLESVSQKNALGEIATATSAVSHFDDTIPGLKNFLCELVKKFDLFDIHLTIEKGMITIKSRIPHEQGHQNSYS